MIATRSLWLAIVKDLLLLCEELILELEDLERQCKNLKARQAVEPGCDTTTCHINPLYYLHNKINRL